MKRSRILGAMSALACLLLAPLRLAAIELSPVVSTGLSNPLFVGHAGDGSNRLFIVEQGGVISVLPPGSPPPLPFLDIRTKIVAGGEQGLLGLAFHPQYGSMGRFFLSYTRAGDGALVIAEYRVSADPDVADPTERVLLTIPHPTHTNHYGGMLAFGPDGYLYIGVGDGGSANDPTNNAQNVDVLLGKILRIDVDPGDGSGPLYLAPPTNPFSGATPGRDEIFALGFRNPWRFSFDRVTGQQWVADVGQGAREEVDTPIVAGGNYGWRVYEGLLCTGNDPALCNPANHLFPIVDYAHVNGRCAVTGGYVYRGAQGTLPLGTYVYGDFCSGEIFGWDGSTQSILLDTTLHISSFGEDEAGELYVVDLRGTVSKIVPRGPADD
jgi:glucose/arabinose dehydrogenase